MADIHIYAPLCIAASAVFPPLCAALAFTRFYARKKSGAGYSWDDWLVLPSLLMIIGMSAAILQGVADKSVGYRSPPIPPGETILTVTSYEQRKTRSIFWCIELMQVPALTSIKLSFMFFYRRIFGSAGGKTVNITSWVLITLITGWGLAYFFATLFICPGHPDAYWTSLVALKKDCIDTVMLHNSSGVTDVTLDVLVILFPIPWIWQLHLSLRKKLAVTGIFALGIFTIVASVFRMITTLQSTKVEIDPNTDTDLLITGGIYWGMVESSVALISACLPTVQGVFRSQVIAKGVSAAKSLQRDGLRLSITRSRSKRYTDSSRRSYVELDPVGHHNTINRLEEDDPSFHVSPGGVLVTKTFGSERLSRSEV